MHADKRIFTLDAETCPYMFRVHVDEFFWQPDKFSTFITNLSLPFIIVLPCSLDSTGNLAPSIAHFEISCISSIESYHWLL